MKKSSRKATLFLGFPHKCEDYDLSNINTSLHFVYFVYCIFLNI
jgi:hypothetical protein